MTEALQVPYLAKGDMLRPAYTRAGDAAMDLRAAIGAYFPPGSQYVIPTGVKVAIPPGYAGLVLPRSGLALNHGITVLNAPGLIDPNYRGEIKVLLINTNLYDAFEVERGDRIAQFMVVPVAPIELVAVDELPETERADNGFGSSGRT